MKPAFNTIFLKNTRVFTDNKFSDVVHAVRPRYEENLAMKKHLEDFLILYFPFRTLLLKYSNVVHKDYMLCVLYRQTMYVERN